MMHKGALAMLLNFKGMKSWQIKKLLIWLVMVVIIGGGYLAWAGMSLYQDKTSDSAKWEAALKTSPELQAKVDARSANAVPVTTGSYVENLKEINIKSSYFRLVAQIWFRWEGDPGLDMMNNFEVYKGLVNKMEVIKDFHEGTTNYQLVRLDVSVTKNFWTKRFPLESHQLRFYVESLHPIEQVVLAPDTALSGLNENLDIAGFRPIRHVTGVIAHEYQNSFSDPQLDGAVITSEFVTAIEVNRYDFGLYVKCFIALVGTLTWVLITLFLSTYHRIDPLGMVPGTLFGTVTNIMVGANLLPDALAMGLLEYVNTWGIMTILGVTIAIININSSRNQFNDKDFAVSYGKLMFYSILGITLLGHILLPVCAFIF